MASKTVISPILHCMQVLFECHRNEASHRKKRQLNWCFLSLFLLLSIVSAFVTNMFFIEAFAGLRICLFRYVFCRNLAKLVFLIQYKYIQ